MKNGKCSIKAVLLIAFLLLLFLPMHVSAQSGTTLGGRVTDSSQAVLTNAEVTATNIDTGIESKASTNNAGFYNFASLQPGTYRVSAQAPGFQERTTTDVRLRAGASSTLNFEMAVAGISTDVYVTGAAENMILDAGSSTGTIMQEELVGELPLVGNNVMELLNSMGGVIKAEEPIFGASNQSFAGISGGSINITRDGVSASDIRYNSGVSSTSYVNQELVGEFKMILSPVDAELGRGAGQVQITTRSGGNALHGSGVWNLQNTALDARKFEDKRQGLTPPWRNVNNYTLSASGPIIKNRTFFFASWDQQIVRTKEWAVASALTDCARMGIYRYYDHVVSISPIDAADYSRYDADEYDRDGNFIRVAPYPRRVTVTSATDGTPNLQNKPTQSNGQLLYQSVFGPLTSDARNAMGNSITSDCKGYADYIGFNLDKPTFNNTNLSNSIGGAPFDATYRNGFDTSGYVETFFDTDNYLPRANYYGYGDGLNTAGYRWWRTTKGTNNIFGTGEDNRRRQFTAKIDHNLTDTHRLSGTYTIEKNAGEDGGVAWERNSYIGRNWRKPQSLTLSLTSTLKPTLLNEFRFGYTRVTGYVMSSIDASDGDLAPLLNDLAKGINTKLSEIDRPLVISYDGMQFGPILGFQNTMSVSHPYMSRGLMNNTWGGTDNSYNFSDSITWMKGSHSFKGGVTVKLNQAWYSQDGDKSGSGPYIPAIRTGDLGGSAGLTRADLAVWGPDNWPGITTNTAGTTPGLASSINNNNQGATVGNMLNFLSGTVNGVAQAFYIVKDSSAPGGYRWNDIYNGENEYINDLRSREFSFFFKDDWRVTSDLTLNLGVRYEYFGVPWEANGMTAALKGGSSNIQGASATWMNWLELDSNPVATEYQFVGPNSNNSDLRPWNKDTNNFAPHVGFSWQLPWLGRGMTTLRGGYSISYSPITNFDNMVGVLATVAGTANNFQYDINNADRLAYYNLANVGAVIGGKDATNSYILRPPVSPMQPIAMMSGSATIYDENIRNPYTHSLNMSLTRQIGRSLTVDVRYVGNLSRNLLSGVNLNTPKYMDNGLFEEFDKIRRNGTRITNSEIPILNDILGTPMGQSAAQYILNPNYPNLMDFISFGNGFNQLATGDYSGLAGTLARYGSFGAGQPGNAIVASVRENNFIFSNPDLQSATIMTNEGYTNYHSMQAQVTMRPVRGLSFQSTYTWSRNIGDRGVENYATGSRRYYLSDQHRSHSLTTYGSYTLPFGANGFFFRDVSGGVKKAIEGWGLSWVANISSGAPMSIGGGSTYWGINNPELIRPDLWDNKAGKVEYKWNPDGTWSHATFYGDKYIKVPDMNFCGPINHDPIPPYGDTPLLDYCLANRFAIALASDPSTIVIQNAEIGKIGNMSPNSLTGPGRWTLDIAMSKAVEFMEGKTIDIRIDAANIFNHATPSGTADTFNHAPRYDVINLPQTGLNNRTMPGYIATKSGHRTFQGKVSIRF